jgi:hypothetical protein
MKPTDYVARACVADISGCTVIQKCDECKKEIVKLVELDEMFVDYFKRLEYLKKKLDDEKKDETA